MSGGGRRRVTAAGLVLAALGVLGWMLWVFGGPDAPIGGPGASLAELGSQGSGDERALVPLSERGAAESTAGTTPERDQLGDDRSIAPGLDVYETIELAPAATVAGSVATPDGTPVAGVVLRVIDSGGWHRERLVTTAPDGRYVAEFEEMRTLVVSERVFSVPLDSGREDEESSQPARRLIRPSRHFEVRLQLDRRGRFSHADPQSVTLPDAGGTADFVLHPLPVVRVRVVDAVDGRPIPDATVEGWYTERDGDALVIWLDGHVGSKRGTIGVGFSAPGYVPAQAWITPPEAGVATRAEPVVLEPGVEVSGTLRKRGGAGLAGWIVAEPLDVDSVTPPLSGANTRDDGRWRLLLRPGRYRLLALVFGRPPWRGTLQAAPGADPVAIEVAEPGEDVPAAPRFAWAQRRDLELPFMLPIMAFGGAERVRWLAEIADAPIAIDDDVTERLAASTAPALRAGEGLYRALRETARAARVDADYLAGRVRAPR